MAEIVATSPVDPPETENVGVVSLVTSSEPDRPVSEAGARSGTPGADGAVLSIVTVVPAESAAGPVVPPVATTEDAESVGVTVPSPHSETVTVKTAVVPVVGETVNTQFAAFPLFVNSLESRVEASTVSVKVSV